MSSDQAFYPAHYVMLAVREEKAARESDTDVARVSHLGLATLYRECAAGLVVQHEGQPVADISSTPDEPAFWHRTLLSKPRSAARRAAPNRRSAARR